MVSMSETNTRHYSSQKAIPTNCAVGSIKSKVRFKSRKGTDDWPCFVSVPSLVRSSHTFINLGHIAEFVTPQIFMFTELKTVQSELKTVQLVNIPASD